MKISVPDLRKSGLFSKPVAPALTARENVMLPLELVSDEQIAEQPVEVGLGEGCQLSHDTSGGEQQRVAIAARSPDSHEYSLQMNRRHLDSHR